VRRERFGARELATVLSHYDLGTIAQMRTFPHGSRRAPKVRIRCERGELLLKRRAPGRDDPSRVAFSHRLLRYLETQEYPVAALLPTRDGSSSPRWAGRTYELFRFVEGGRPGETPQAAARSGAALGMLHGLLEGFEASTPPAARGYHAAPGLPPRLAGVPPAVLAADPDADSAELSELCAELGRAYSRAALRADEAGYRGLPEAVLHGDWHPGNLIEREGRIVAVLDFDSARLEPRCADLANALLQYSMPLSARCDPEDWPEGLDIERMRMLLEGYRAAGAHTIGAEELRALPWLMIEALIVESVVPIAATGAFGPARATSVLRMVRRTARWIWSNGGDLVGVLACPDC
jgi:Ser/Thr protein kinase RdoA (MazF antagonist)